MIHIKCGGTVPQILLIDDEPYNLSMIVEMQMHRD